MAIMRDVDQLSPAWFAARRGRVTASQFYRALNPRRRETYLRELNAQLDGAAEPARAETADMLRGRAHEDRGVAVFGMMTGLTAIEVAYVTHERHPILLASPDRLVYNEHDLIGPLEVKSPRLENFARWQAGDFPQEALDQLYCQIWCLQSSVPGIEGGWLCGYNDKLPPDAGQCLFEFFELPRRWVESAEKAVEWFEERLGKFIVEEEI